MCSVHIKANGGSGEMGVVKRYSKPSVLWKKAGIFRQKMFMTIMILVESIKKEYST